ncbi:hypothetical protein GGI10_004750 [Coemansia sp. RSA 2530]|nr:hypothetical protein GGI10_004750 [Coemansia sp. RSA 2530]
MTSNGKKRSAVLDTETTKATTAAATQSATAADSEHRHPCFWGVLHGESLKFVFVSASLQGFLGGERSAALPGQSLFDFIHPEEANRARHDLVDTFISKPFLGSNIRCRLRRFDLENTGFQQFIRRASESHILRIGHAARHVHDALERKLSLPTIPDIAKLRAAGHHGTNHSAAGLANLHHLPKRLKTILEDSVGALGGTDRIHTDEDNTTPSSNEDGDSSDNGYLIANIALYLVSTHFSIMVCHYEESSLERLSPLSPPLPPPPTLPPQQQLQPEAELAVAPCACAAATPVTVDFARVRLVLSHIQKLHTIDSYRSQPALSPGGRLALVGNGGGLVTRHAQVYSIKTKALLCAFPEEGYRKIYGRSPVDAAKEGAGICSLWKHCRDKKVERHATELLSCPGVRASDPIRLETQVRSVETPDVVADVQSLLFRWGHLLFVCQQMRSDCSPREAVVDMPLSGYNLSTPPIDNSMARGGGLPPEVAVRCDPSSPFYIGAGSRAAMRQQGAATYSQQSPGSPAAAGAANSPDTRPFSQARAPVTVAANLPIRSVVSTLAPPESVPPRRQSSYTLPPVKSFEERRFSHPIQSLVGDHRPPPPLPSIPSHMSPPTLASSTASSSLLQQYHSQQAMSVCGPATPISASGSYPMGAPRSSPLGMVSSPGSRLVDMRQRAAVGSSSGGMRSGGSQAFKNGNGDSGLPSSAPGSASASTQPTPNISPMTACIIHHTPVSMSPAPQSSHPGYVQVNLYPPPEVSGGSESWRWSNGQMHVQRQLLPLAPGNVAGSPHGHGVVHSAGGVNEQYQSPVASAVASPGALSGSQRGDLEKKTCKSCGTDSSPEWRKGPNGHKTYVVRVFVAWKNG